MLRAGTATAAAAAIAAELVPTAPGRVEVAGEVQLGIEVARADQRHAASLAQRAAAATALATNWRRSTSTRSPAAVVVVAELPAAVAELPAAPLDLAALAALVAIEHVAVAAFVTSAPARERRAGRARPTAALSPATSPPPRPSAPRLSPEPSSRP